MGILKIKNQTANVLGFATLILIALTILIKSGLFPALNDKLPDALALWLVILIPVIVYFEWNVKGALKKVTSFQRVGVVIGIVALAWLGSVIIEVLNLASIGVPTWLDKYSFVFLIINGIAAFVGMVTKGSE